MVHLAFLLALTSRMFAYGKRAGFPVAGACAGLLVFASPVVGIDGTSAYNDVAVAAIAFTVFYLLQIWDEQRSTRLLIAIGLTAGFAYATKYTAGTAVIYAIDLVAGRAAAIASGAHRDRGRMRGVTDSSMDIQKLAMAPEPCLAVLQSCVSQPLCDVVV